MQKTAGHNVDWARKLLLLGASEAVLMLLAPGRFSHDEIRMKRAAKSYVVLGAELQA